MSFSNSDKAKNVSPTIACWGTSMSQGSGSTGGYDYPNQLQALLSRSELRIVKNFGIGGQTSDQIASRQGGKPLYITLNGNAFNGTNSVSITAMSSQCLSTLADNATRYMSGFVRCDNGGVQVMRQCFITRTATGGSSPYTEVYTITPIQANTFNVPANSIFYPDEGNNHLNSINIFELGQNDGAASYANLLKNFDNCINSLRKPKRFIIVGRGVDSTGIIGTTQYNDVININTQLMQLYGSNYVSIMDVPTVNEMAALNYTPSTQDNADIANGIIPSGMRFQGSVHFNNIGYGLLAYRVKAVIESLNW